MLNKKKKFIIALNNIVPLKYDYVKKLDFESAGICRDIETQLEKIVNINHSFLFQVFSRQIIIEKTINTNINILNKELIQLRKVIPFD